MAAVTLRSLPPDTRPIAGELLERGWTMHRQRNGHFRFRHPGGQHSVVFPRSPSDWRALRNLRGDIRRIERAANTN